MDIKTNKTLKVKEYLLSGKTLTGLELMLDFGCLAYRDVIYRLRKQGLNIQSRMVGNNVKHAVYWIDTEDIERYDKRLNKNEGLLEGVVNYGEK